MIEAYSHVTTRRSFLTGTIRAGAGLAAISIVGCSENPSPISTELKRSNAAEKIRRFENEVGSNPLTVEQARALISVLSRLYIESTGSKKSPKELERSIHIMHGNFDIPDYLKQEVIAKQDKDDLSASVDIQHYKDLEGVKNMQKDYPDLVFDDFYLRNLAYQFSQSLYGIVTDQNGKDVILINLNRTNNPSPENVQYKEPKSQTDCSAPTPASVFRNVALHESAHWDIDAKNTVDDNLNKTVTNIVYRSTTGHPLPDGAKSILHLTEITGFSAHLTSRQIFEELVADYIAAKISSVNGFDNISNLYTKPNDVYNLGIIFQSAGINDQELLRLHRNSLYKEFLIRIGSVLQKSASDQICLEAAIEAEVFMRNFTPIRWAQLKRMFPNLPQIDEGNYIYAQHLTRGFTIDGIDNQINGCLPLK